MQTQNPDQSLTEYCPRCRATATRSEAMAEAYAWAGIPAEGGTPIPWSNFNPPGSGAFKTGPVWADFKRLYNNPLTMDSVTTAAASRSCCRRA